MATETGAKRYLERVHNMKLQLHIKLELLEQLKEMTCRVTASYGGERVDKTPGKSPMEDAILRLEEEKRAVQAYIDRMMDLRNEVARQIEGVENAGHRNLLELRYLCGYSFDRIAVALDTSMGNVYKQHHGALRAFEKIYGRGHAV
jgi:hypothetical protein